MWPNSPETQELLDRAKQGEAGAVERLLEVHREPLRRMVGLRLDPALAGRVDASDIVQDVMLEVSQRLADYLRNPQMPFHLWVRHIAKDHMIDAHRRFQDYLRDPKMPFTLWLRHIAQDRIIDTHRRHQEAGRRSIDREQAAGHLANEASSVMLVAQLVDQELTPASAAIQQELTKKLQVVMTELDETDREIILMRYYEQMSNQEIAEALGLTEAAASMRHLRALRRLKDAFTTQ